jgi:acyl-lipid omega-6 desaturase (Delta-12 desaturase)
MELAVTAGPLALLWALAWLTVEHGHWWGVMFTLPAAAFLVRLFMIQHDCGHGAFFPDKGLNDWIGRAIGVVTLTPYDHWRRAHAMHHATSGDLDRRGVGDVETLTVAEYLAMSSGKRLAYRLFRHPLVMFGLGPIYVFLLRHRLPIGEMRAGWRPWFSAMATNLAIAAAAVGLILLGGVRAFLMIQLPISLIAGMIGVWLFYVQHQFEGVVWTRSSRWTLAQAALHGSSHYHLPGIVGWFTANIGVHHVHHLSSRIPFYRLREVLRDHPELDARRLTLAQSLRGTGLALWDEPGRRLISFRELRERMAPVPAAVTVPTPAGP